MTVLPLFPVGAATLEVPQWCPWSQLQESADCEVPFPGKGPCILPAFCDDKQDNACTMYKTISTMHPVQTRVEKPIMHIEKYAYLTTKTNAHRMYLTTAYPFLGSVNPSGHCQHEWRKLVALLVLRSLPAPPRGSRTGRMAATRARDPPIGGSKSRIK